MYLSNSAFFSLDSLEMAKYKAIKAQSQTDLSSDNCDLKRKNKTPIKYSSSSDDSDNENENTLYPALPNKKRKRLFELVHFETIMFYKS